MSNSNKTSNTSNKNETNSSWGGRFTESTDAFVAAFTASIQFDQRLYKHDIAGSKAHAQMLNKVGILTTQEVKDIHNGLDEIQSEIEAGNFDWSIELEDIHMNIEARLTDKIGITGKKLHTGRSRNDQVATDIRLWLREQIDLISSELKRLQVGLLEVAEREADTILPGFTHLQVAQPITFGHHMLAWYEMLVRDVERLQDCRARVNVLPLGAAALAGSCNTCNPPSPARKGMVAIMSAAFWYSSAPSPAAGSSRMMDGVEGKTAVSSAFTKRCGTSCSNKS